MEISEPAIVSGFAIMGAAIAELYRRAAKFTDKIEGKLLACEKKHEARDAEQKVIAERVARMEGREQGIKELAEKVLEAVRKQ